MGMVPYRKGSGEATRKKIQEAGFLGKWTGPPTNPALLHGGHWVDWVVSSSWTVADAPGAEQHKVSAMADDSF